MPRLAADQPQLVRESVAIQAPAHPRRRVKRLVGDGVEGIHLLAELLGESRHALLIPLHGGGRRLGQRLGREEDQHGGAEHAEVKELLRYLSLPM